MTPRQGDPAPTDIDGADDLTAAHPARGPEDRTSARVVDGDDTTPREAAHGGAASRTGMAGPADARPADARPAEGSAAEESPETQVASGAPADGPGAVRSMAPGIGLALAVAFVAWGINMLVPPLSALLVAILIGVVVVNVMPLPESTAPGLAFASKKLLRAGIVLLGLQVSLLDIAGLGFGMIGVVVAVVVGGLAVAEYGGRMIGVSPPLRSLIGAGFSICGAAAVAGVEGVIDDKKDEDVVTAVALVVLFGTLMIPLVPLLVAAFGLGERDGGLWAGSSIHEVAQVVAAAGIIGGSALKTAVVVKLARVLMLAPVAVWFGWQMRRGTVGPRPTGQKLPPIVPLFIVGFLIAVVVRTLGIVPAPALDAIKMIQTVLLAAAMFGLGCGVRFATLKTVGGKPFVLGTVVTLAVASIGLGGVLLVG